MMGNSFSRSQFKRLQSYFEILGIGENDAVGKDYGKLQKCVQSMYYKRASTTHPDKQPAKSSEEMAKIKDAYRELKRCIEELQGGKDFNEKCQYIPQDICIERQDLGKLSWHEFMYRAKLFRRLGISFDDITKGNMDCSKWWSELQKECDNLRDLLSIINGGNLNSRSKAYKELESYQQGDYGKFLTYILPLRDRSEKCRKPLGNYLGNLIEEDKEYIRSRFIWKKFAAYSVSVPLGLVGLSTVIVGHYVSLWIIVPSAIFMLIGVIWYGYRSRCSNDDLVLKFGRKNPYIYNLDRKGNEERCDTICNVLSVSKLLYLYPVSIFSVYLLTMQLTEVQNIGLVVLSSLFVLSILIEIFSATFSKGCEIFSEKHIRDLFPSKRMMDWGDLWEENSIDKVEKPTDLLKWYDLRWLLMPLVMPKVETCFKELIDELNDRNFCPDPVDTNMDDTVTETVCIDRLLVA